MTLPKTKAEVHPTMQEDLKFVLEKEDHTEEEDPQRLDLWILAQVKRQEEAEKIFSPITEPVLKKENIKNTRWKQDLCQLEKLEMQEFLKQQTKWAITPEPAFSPIFHHNNQHIIYIYNKTN